MSASNVRDSVKHSSGKEIVTCGGSVGSLCVCCSGGQLRVDESHRVVKVLGINSVGSLTLYRSHGDAIGFRADPAISEHSKHTVEQTIAIRPDDLSRAIGILVNGHG